MECFVPSPEDGLLPAQRRSKTNLIAHGEWKTLLSFCPPRATSGLVSSPHDKARRVISLARAGNLGAATRMLTSGVVQNPQCEDVYQALSRLHPAGQRPAALWSSGSPGLEVDEELICRVLRSLPPRRAADAAGWRGEYLRRLTPRAHQALAELVNKLINDPNFVPKPLRPYMFGARLVALGKKDGGTRPIAVGTILRKIVSQCIADSIKGQLPECFVPHQFGVGLPGGGEDVVHGIRVMRVLRPGRVLLSVDFTNAFNSVQRSAIARRVHKYFPELSGWFDQCYGSESLLLVPGRDPILSTRGVQQGDPLGPFFFALALQPALIRAAKHAMVMAYLDDVYIFGEPEQVRHSFNRLVSSCGQFGLTCNLQKCWSTAQLIEGIPVKEDARMLGANLSAFAPVPSSAAPTHLIEQISLLPDPQVALLLLRYAHNTRLSFLLRTMSAEATRDVCEATMAATRECLAKILDTNDHNPLPPTSWSQALLPRGPGLGLDDLPRLAPLAFAASLIETTWRLPMLDEAHFGSFSHEEAWNLSDPLVQAWNRSRELLAQYGDQIEERSAKLQRIFARDLKKERLESFLSDAAVPDHNKAIVRSTMDSPLSSQLMNAIPTEKGLSLYPQQMRTALRLLLGVPIDLGCQTCVCGRPMDHYASHALSCKRGGGMIMRHDMLKRFFEKMCNAAGISTRMEPLHFFPDDNKKPDLVLYHHGSQGKDVAIDFSLLNPTNPGSLKTSARDGQALLYTRELQKFRSYDSKCQQLGHIFMPSVFSVFGGTTRRNMLLVVDPIIRRISKKYFVAPNWAAPDKRTYWLQRLIVAIWNGVTTNIKRFQALGPTTTSA